MRVNIYIPDPLHLRMKKARDVNWSEVAQRAFEQKLGEIAASKPKPTMNDTIDRLRASKAKATSAARRSGRKTGEIWAKRRAEYENLKAVAELREGPDWDRVAASGELPVVIARFALGEERGVSTRELCELFDSDDFVIMRSSAEEQIEFCEGFLEGVEEVWEAVEGEI